MPDFSCGTCGRAFNVPDATLAKFPGWTPKQCLNCKGSAKKAASKAARRSSRDGNRSIAEVLAKFSDGPVTGVFTDGAASPNPGPGGWGAVYVVGDAVVAKKHGHEAHTTNNRMELTALIAGFKLVPPGVATTIYTDSELCVNTITKWAATWKRNGWRKKDGEIKNLELVKELYALAESRPDLRLQWLKAHAGSKWNEYADSLATAYRRAEV